MNSSLMKNNSIVFWVFCGCFLKSFVDTSCYLATYFIIHSFSLLPFLPSPFLPSFLPLLEYLLSTYFIAKPLLDIHYHLMTHWFLRINRNTAGPQLYNIKDNISSEKVRKPFISQNIKKIDSVKQQSWGKK